VDARALALFEPKPAQQWLFDRLERFNVIVCHRAFGKTSLAVNTLIRQALLRPGTLYAFITDTRLHAKDIAWEKVLKPALAPLAERVTIHESELRVHFSNGSEISLYGAEKDEGRRIRGLHFDGVVCDEYGTFPPGVWEISIAPTLVRRDGGAMFIGTPMGKNHFWELYQKAQGWPDWFVTRIRADQSGVLTAAQLENQQRIQTPEQYAQEFECSFETAIAGSYYARELRAAREQGRVKAVPWDPVLEVETWWDLGHTDATAVVFTQVIGNEIHVIDFVEDERKDLAFYAKALRDRPYLYRAHHLPHDADARLEAAAGHSIAMQLRPLLAGSVRTHPRQAPLEGITRARVLFARCWFDQEKCERLLDALAYYHAKHDPRNDVDKPEPAHDWSSHAADAFRLMATEIRPAMSARPPRPALMDFDVFNWDRPRRAARTAVLDFDPFAA
jgi:phage terminase large subunit